MPRVIQVIESEEHRGAGVETDPARMVTRYYTLDGEWLAERDRWQEEEYAVFVTQRNLKRSP